nr:DUF3888 domain-containing protein [Clostridium sp. YIM B02506]
MKKILFGISLLVGIMSFTTECSAYELLVEEPIQLTENSKEIIYRDVITSLLVPHIQKEVNNYYKEYLTEAPMIFAYSVDIISAKRQYETGYLIELEVIAHPYVGAHNTVGDERLIIETGGLGSVEVKKFEHIKSYPLPTHLQNIIKKPY